MTPLGHVMILASAGSGKTYALTNRFIKLLALGAPPERMVALTFTRKAAAEFFDEILTKLAAAARSPAAAAELAGKIGERQLDQPRFLQLLRATTDAMHRLSLGTIDSFFARIVRNFPLELGLGGDFQILPESMARLERRRVLRRMFQGGGGLSAAQREFIEAFKRATFGAEEKQLGQRLDAFFDEHQEVYLAAPEGDRWGQPGRIWPRGCAWLAGAANRATAAQNLRTALPWDDMNEKQRARWEALLEALPGWQPGAPLPAAVEYLLKNTLEEWPGLEEVRVERRRLALPPPAREALRGLVTAIIGGELGRRLEMTRGIHAVLRGYDTVYHEAVRRAGRLTFADVQRLLAPDAGAPPLSGETGAGRLFLDFRLDARFDHWLLDEFQDTSFGQWSVLRNLIDEAVQDAAGRRSFFYVGDVKQAIFAWREGDPRLFREVFDHYNRGAPGTIGEERLDRSFRSGPAVIGAVNRVFGAAPVLQRLLPAAAATAWIREWRDHVSAKPELGGHAALLHAATEEERFARVGEILREVQPLARGLTCAVLVQRNDTATRLADYLRRAANQPALAESDLCVCVDNPLGAALLSLCKAAAHPGDTLAQEHVRMTPLGAVLEKEGLMTPDALTARLLDEFCAGGFEHTMEAWLRRLEPHLVAGDSFTRERAAQFAAAARLFDETGSRSVIEFIRFMESYTEREVESAAVVRVMTIHKAKGLGFDLVLLPDLEGHKLDERREGLAVQKAADRSVEWVLDLPPRLFYGVDEVLAAHVRAAEADACYEKLSVLYVAMTRARRAMYLITAPPGDSRSNNFPRLLAETLDGEAKSVRIGTCQMPGTYAEGDADWHTRMPAAPPPRPVPAAVPALDPAKARRGLRLRARRPSELARWTGSGLVWGPPGAGGAAEFGAAVHRLFATVEWWKPDDTENWLAARRAEGAEEAALAEALGCLREPALAGVFVRPAASAEAWRERAFEVVLDGAWVTGVFDRVIVERDAAGRAFRASVVDFKTDRGSEAADLVARYAGQLNLYRRAAAILAAIPPERVTCHLIHTAQHRAVPVPPS
jgi:ATP-dependent exoDNAse (exonuclease V) beta subunit